ncbi:MAG: apolipoprotein N-acyltransferase [Pseudomonadota bacterium]
MQRLSQRVLLLSGWRRALVAILAGALTTLVLAPFHLFFVGFLTFPILVWLLDGAVGDSHAGRFRRLRPSFFVGWWFGFGYFTAGLWWIANALLVEAPEFAWAIPLAVLGLPAVLAVFYGLAAAFARAFWPDNLLRIFVLAAFFGVGEWLRSFVLTGFPWNAIGYGIMPSPLMMQSVSMTGAEAMNILAVLLFALPAGLAQSRRSAALSIALVVMLLGSHVGFGYWRLEIIPDAQDEGRIIRLVQPAIDQSEKWEPEQAKSIFDSLLVLSIAPGVSDDVARPSLIIWPETAVPFILTREPAAVGAIAEALQIGQSLVAGVVREEQDEGTESEEARFYNSMLMIDSEGIISDAADKVHLVPFGEYLPFAEQLGKLGIKAIAAADRGYIGAPQRRSLKLTERLSAIPLICYEAIFASEVNPLTETDGLIINITNDAWYGNTPGPRQHFHQSQLRSVELGLPMARAANNGISAIVDAKGRIVERLDFGTAGAIDATLPGKIELPYGKRYSSHIFWLIVLLFATLGAMFRPRH